MKTALKEQLLRQGLVLLPLKQGTKQPVVPWAALQNGRPSFSTIKLLADMPAKDWGTITGPATGLYCLDYDAPPYPDGYEYTPTPSGGRHYYFPWDDSYGHQIRIQPNLDIPWITKIYGPVKINNCRPPVIAPKRIQVIQDHSDVSYDDLDANLFDQCEFITWFKQRRNQPDFENRYPVARAYASNIVHADEPDLSLGEGYQHTDDVYNRIRRPIGCDTITQHYPCSYWNGTSCAKRHGVTSPYGLAVKLNRAKSQRV